MQKSTIYIASSISVLAALLIYNSFKTTPEETTPLKDSKSEKVMQSVEIEPVKKQEIIEITPKQEPLTEQAVEKKAFVTKYALSVLPDGMSVQEKKQRFKELLLPAIEKVYTKLNQQYEEAKLLIEQETDKEKITQLMDTYNAVDEQDLLKRLKPHPKSIAIAQAAMQSGWATSRFTLIANNLFGVWSFDENEPRIQANEKRDNTNIYVKRYATLQESIEDYYKLLATSALFEEFREEKMKTDDPYLLIQSLDKYYKKGDDFTKGLSELIKYNEFDKYDDN